MSHVARLHLIPTEPSATTERALELGPADVLETGPLGVRIRLKSGAEREAQVALAFSYEPAVGDVVLAIADGASCWVIGVITGTGKGTLSFPGDLQIQAGGRLALSGQAGVEIDTPKLEVRAGKLEMLARSVSQRFENLRQHVVELLSVQAGRTHTIVEGSSVTSAESSTLLTKDKVTINGKAIHLG